MPRALYGSLPPRQVGSPTSTAAAVAVIPHAQAQRDRIEAYLKARGAWGATRDEMETDLRLSGDTVRPRCRELEKLTRVVNSGRTRLTRSGHAAAVYIAVEATGQLSLGV